MRGKLLIFAVFCILLASSALAATQIDTEPIDASINLGERATYKVTITNELNLPQTYNIYHLLGGLDWQVSTSPVSDRSFTLSSGESKTVTLTIRPLKEFSDGIYSVSPVIIETDKGEVYQESFRVQIGTPGPQSYAPAISLEIDADTNIDPRDAQSIRVTLQNINPLNFEKIILRSKSDLGGYNTEQELSLAGLEKKIVTLAVTPNPHQQPKEYLVFFTIERDEEIISIKEKRITVQPLDLKFDVQVEETKNFLVTTKRLTVTNTGNTINTQTVSLPVEFFEGMLIRSNPDGVVGKVDGQRSLNWEIKLAPEEQLVLSTSTNYLPPVAILLAIIFLSVVYYFSRNEVTITKSAGNISVQEEGVSQVKITLMVRNTSNRPVKDVKIIDVLPSIVNVDKDIEAGTLRPSEVKRLKKHTKVIWKLTELEGHEERLISYKINSALKIVGTVTLPRSKVKYKNARGKNKQSFSNSYSIDTKPQKTE